MPGLHLTRDQRVQLEVLVKTKRSVKEMAAVLGCSVRTVYRELKRGKCQLLDGKTWKMYDSYSSQIAQNDYDLKAQTKGAPLKLGKNFDLAQFLEKYIRLGFSPAAALAEVKLQHLDFGFTISTTTLYRYIYLGFLHLQESDLPIGRYRVKHRDHVLHPVSSSHALDKNISQRPKEVADRQISGHWEMDTVIGKCAGRNKCLLVLTERKTRYELIVLIRSKSSAEVLRGLCKLHRRFGSDFKKIFLSITCDNGSEFADAKGMEKFAPIYYCHPYNAWERGSNENANKLIRRFIPKGTSMNHLTAVQVEYIQLWMNNYPRKILGWNRPADLFEANFSVSA